MGRRSKVWVDGLGLGLGLGRRSVGRGSSWVDGEWRWVVGLRGSTPSGGGSPELGSGFVALSSSSWVSLGSWLSLNFPENFI